MQEWAIAYLVVGALWGLVMFCAADFGDSDEQARELALITFICAFLWPLSFLSFLALFLRNLYRRHKK